jgi:cytochrome P450
VASFAALEAALLEAMDYRDAPLLAAAADSGALTRAEAVANAAVALFGGIETVEGMICNAVLHLLGHYGTVWAEIDLDHGVEESLRLEPAAAVVDRYATRDVTAVGALVRRGDLVRVSLAGANRDPAVFPNPDQFDPARANAGRHLAFARGPHFCIGAHLARLETVTAVRALLDALPGLRLDVSRPLQVRGLVFRKPTALPAIWEPHS